MLLMFAIAGLAIWGCAGVFGGPLSIKPVEMGAFFVVGLVGGYLQFPGGPISAIVMHFLMQLVNGSLVAVVPDIPRHLLYAVLAFIGYLVFTITL